MSPCLLGRRVGLIVVVAAVAHGCASTNRLNEYEYEGTLVGAFCRMPPEPNVLTRPLAAAHSADPIGRIVDAGVRVIEGLSARDAYNKLNLATSRVDVAYLMEQDVLDRVSRYMGARPSGDLEDVDYVMEIEIREYGIDADSWNAPAEFFLDAEAVLLQRATGHEIWSSAVHERDPIGPDVLGGDVEARSVITAAALVELSPDEIARAIEQLAYYSARNIAERFRHDLREARTGPP